MQAVVAGFSFEAVLRTTFFYTSLAFGSGLYLHTDKMSAVQQNNSER